MATARAGRRAVPAEDRTRRTRPPGAGSAATKPAPAAPARNTSTATAHLRKGPAPSPLRFPHKARLLLEQHVLVVRKLHQQRDAGAADDGAEMAEGALEDRERLGATTRMRANLRRRALAIPVRTPSGMAPSMTRSSRRSRRPRLAWHRPSRPRIRAIQRGERAPRDHPNRQVTSRCGRVLVAQLAGQRMERRDTRSGRSCGRSCPPVTGPEFAHRRRPSCCDPNQVMIEHEAAADGVPDIGVEEVGAGGTDPNISSAPAETVASLKRNTGQSNARSSSPEGRFVFQASSRPAGTPPSSSQIPLMERRGDAEPAMRSGLDRLVLAAHAGDGALGEPHDVVGRRIVEQRAFERDHVADEIDQGDVGAAVVDLEAEGIGGFRVQRVGTEGCPSRPRSGSRRSSSSRSAARFTMVVMVCAASPVSRVKSVFAKLAVPADQRHDQPLVVDAAFGLRGSATAAVGDLFETEETGAGHAFLCARSCLARPRHQGADVAMRACKATLKSSAGKM